MIGTATDWPTVDPEKLRTMADCETFDDLDYLIVARAAMLKHVPPIRVEEAKREILPIVLSYNFSGGPVEIRRIPPLRAVRLT